MVGYSLWGHKRVGHNLVTKQVIILASEGGTSQTVTWEFPYQLTEPQVYHMHSFCLGLSTSRYVGFTHLSNQSILKEPTLNTHWKDWCWNWSSNTLSTWCKEPIHWKNLMLGTTEGRRTRGWQRTRLLDGIINSTDMSLSKLQDIVKDREAWHAAVHGLQTVGHNWVTEHQPTCSMTSP